MTNKLVGVLGELLSTHGCSQHFTRFPPLRRPLVVNVPFWVVWWAGAHHKSPRSWLLLIPRAQRYLTFRFGFPRAFRCSRGKHVWIPCAVSRDQIHHRLWFCCDSFFTLCQHVCELVLESMYLIWILGSKLILSNNQEELCGFWKHVSLWDFFPLWGGRSRQGSPSPCRRSTQCYYCPQGSRRSAGGSARECRWMRRRGGLKVEEIFSSCDDHEMTRTSETWATMWCAIVTTRTCLTKQTRELRAHSLHVSIFMCFVWKVLWVLVVTLSLASCVLSLGFTTQRNPNVEFFPSGCCSSCCSQTVFCDRQFHL